MSDRESVEAAFAQFLRFRDALVQGDEAVVSSLTFPPTRARLDGRPTEALLALWGVSRDAISRGGYSFTGRILRAPGERDLIAFALVPSASEDALAVATSTLLLTSGPRAAIALAFIEHLGAWLFWGQPTPAEWSAGEHVEVPVGVNGPTH